MMVKEGSGVRQLLKKSGTTKQHIGEYGKNAASNSTSITTLQNNHQKITVADLIISRKVAACGIVF